MQQLDGQLLSMQRIPSAPCLRCRSARVVSYDSAEAYSSALSPPHNQHLWYVRVRRPSLRGGHSACAVCGAGCLRHALSSQCVSAAAPRGGAGAGVAARDAGGRGRAGCGGAGRLALETYKAGWSVLTATDDGLDLSLEEARKCILRHPGVLRFKHDKVMLRVKMLESLGYAEAPTMAAAQPLLLKYFGLKIEECAAWWKQSDEDEKYKGGKVLKAKTGRYTSPVAVFDFASLYPS